MNRFSFFVAVFLLCVVSTYAVKVVDVDVICKNVDNTPFCLNFLKLKHGVDLVTLAQCTIDAVRIKATSIVNLTTSLISQGGIDSEAKAHYESCLGYFGWDGALSDLVTAEKYLKSEDYYSVINVASTLIVDYMYCVEGESPGELPYPDKTKIPKYAKFIKEVAAILLSISHLLLKKVVV
ncbi:pectinesterase inhibitor 1-like [Vicia villosa]|uniref:pectinesterase inhibitor 1-like n=1 Tax=Vicia villosa TaxID=3911 RepID=UPI00273AD2F2|nr:pectinesterase inhibitor 1-like [Vicia villosa]